jgi:uncharacterized membrane protein YphA (DoxX/SURF4 family)
MLGRRILLGSPALIAQIQTDREKAPVEIEMTRHREIAYILLRVTLGVVFLFSGIGKFKGGLGNCAGGMLQQFSGKLPALLVEPFAYALPFAETTLGALILLVYSPQCPSLCQGCCSRP